MNIGGVIGLIIWHIYLVFIVKVSTEDTSVLNSGDNIIQKQATSDERRAVILNIYYQKMFL